MPITKTNIPNNSLLKKSSMTYDYMDSYQVPFIDKFQNIGINEIAKSFFTSGPVWIGKLFEIRNKIVKFFGLKTSGEIKDRKKILDNFKGEIDERIGLFKVFNRSVNEIIMGEDNKHLNFRVSLFIDDQNENTKDKNLIISTVVKFHNRFGRLYFLIVRPFHKLIVPTMMKGIIKNIAHQN